MVHTLYSLKIFSPSFCAIDENVRRTLRGVPHLWLLILAVLSTLLWYTSSKSWNFIAFMKKHCVLRKIIFLIGSRRSTDREEAKSLPYHMFLPNRLKISSRCFGRFAVLSLRLVFTHAREWGKQCVLIVLALASHLSQRRHWIGLYQLNYMENYRELCNFSFRFPFRQNAR